MHYTIYKITNKINGKYYIGKHQTSDLDDGYFGSGKLISRAIKKYGIENFTKEILFIFDNQQEMNAKEKELVVVSEDTYNLCPGGHGGFGYINENNLWDTPQRLKAAKENLKIAVIHARKAMSNPEIKERTYKKISQSLIGRIGGFKGKTHSQSTKQKMSIRRKNNGKGIRNSQYGTMWITNGQQNKKIKKIDNIPEGWYKGRVII